MNVFQLQGVSVVEFGTTILTDLNLSIESRSKVGISGPSGSGKTTLLKLFNRLQEPSTGTVYYEGQPLKDYDHTLLRREIAFVHQEPLLFSGRVQDDLLYPFSLSRFQQQSPSSEAIHQALEIMHLTPSILNQSITNLSGGEKQRVALVRALLLQPKVLLLDEPTSALDEDMAGDILSRLLHEHSFSAILYITHSQRLLTLAQRQIKLEHGRLEYIEKKEGSIHDSNH